MHSSFAGVAAPDLSHASGILTGSIFQCAAVISKLDPQDVTTAAPCTAGQQPDLAHIAAHYASVWSPCLPLMAAAECCRRYLIVQGKPRMPAYAAESRLSIQRCSQNQLVEAAANCSRYVATSEFGWRSAAVTISTSALTIPPHLRCRQTCDGCWRDRELGGTPLVLPFHLCSRLWPHWGCHGVLGHRWHPPAADLGLCGFPPLRAPPR